MKKSTLIGILWFWVIGLSYSGVASLFGGGALAQAAALAVAYALIFLVLKAGY